MQPAKGNTMINASLLKTFQTPGARYRGKPFWAWNGKLEPEELRRQVRLLRRMGLGGFFMHSRVGLDTAYLSDEWFACVNACIDEARKLKLEAWLYDEDRWPSGAAGGLVTRNPRHRMRRLMVTLYDTARPLAWTADCLGVFVARLDGAAAYGARALPRGSRAPKLAENEKLIVFEAQLQPCSDWYNGYTYLDTLSHAAVRAFLRATHEAYRRRCGREFGRTVPGIFTDEPNHGHKLGCDNNTGSPGGLPWTARLPAVFRRRYGYDLLPHLLELVFDVEGRAMTPARYHYHDCVTHLFVDAFCRQIGEWCARHKLLFTGHMLEEDTLSSQTNMVGSCLRAYEHMQAPGMDLLTEHWRVFNTAKQVSSAARQFGARWRLTETYGCTGWDFPFLGHKALGDWQAALGINLRCQHLAWYTMEGEAKRDYPASIFYQSPWWELYPKVEDYFARLTAVMSRGAEVRDLLVIHPVESMWMLVKLGWRRAPQTQALDEAFARLTNTLLAEHLDFDFGDEELLARHARVTRAGGQAGLRVGRAAYRAVLVPPLTTMRRSTLALLQKFRAAGGLVAFAGDPPAHVEAVPSAEPAAFAAGGPRAAGGGPEAVALLAAACRRVSIAGPDGREIGPALYLLREDRAAFYLFVCNTGEDFTQTPMLEQPMARDRTLAFDDVRIRGFAGCAGAPLELEAETGAVHAARAVPHNGGWEIRTSLPALGSRLFVVPKRPARTAVPPPPPALRTVRTAPLADETWEIALSECANLVLDRPRYRIGAGPWQGPEDILRVDNAVRQALGLRPRGGSMKQPWTQPRPINPRTVPLSLVYAFECQARPSGDLFLALEQPRTFRIRLNGQEVCTEAECGWWVDRSLRKLRLDPAALCLGLNELHMDGDYPATHPGLEIVYLLGHFGTEARGTQVAITAAPAALRIGDWVPQGLAFYSGSVAYRRRVELAAAAGERVFVRLPDYRGVAARIRIDGEVAGIAAWPPQEVEVTAWAGRGPVELQIEIIGHRRNSHGPFHIAQKWPVWTGPGEFLRSGADGFEGYQLVPCGLMQAPEIVVRRAEE